MKFKQHQISTYILYDTAVENIFLSEYMPKAPEHCVKAYLLGQMYAQMGQPADDDQLARSLGITASMLSDCWRYWEDEGVIRRTMENGETRIEFLRLKEFAFGMAPSEETQAEEPALSLSSEAARELFRTIESITGAMLQSRELEEISSWVANLGMPPAVITACYEYCRKRGTVKFSYVKSVLTEWHKKGLTDEEALSDYLAEMDRHYDLYRRVFQAMGYHFNPTEEQKRLMDSWTEDMGFSTEKILEACAKTAGLSNPNIKYVDSVLRGWYAESKEPPKPAAARGDLIKLVQDSYEKDREENAVRTRERLAEIQSRIPRMESILNELKSSSYNLSMAIVSGGGPAKADSLREKIRSLNEEKTGLLLAAGYDKNATDKIYTCPICKDTGILDDGSRCSCFAQKLELAEKGLLK